MSDLYYSASDRADLDEEHDRPPLSFAQEQLWFFERMTPGTTIYNVPLIFRLRGGLDAGVLGRALTEVVRRHEALRTTFGFANGSPYQVIAPATPVDIRLDDLSGIDAGARDAEAIRLVTQEVRTPFDLNRGLLVRARLIRIDRADHVFCLTMHHICTDGWSRGLIVSELSEVYGGLAGGGVPALGELPVQYADFAVWQREWLRGEVLESALRYWEERLAGLPVLELPTDRPRPALRTYQAETVTAVFSGELLDGLRGLARECGVSLFMVLVGAFGVVLSRYSGQEDVPVGTTVLGRGRPELERLVGLFVNVVVLRLDVSGDPSFRELLARVREVTLGAFDHQEVPFEKVVERLAPVRDAGRNPLFQVFLQLLGGGTELTEPVFPGVSAETIEVHQGEQFFDFALTFTERPDRLNLQVEYSVDLFDRWRVEGFVRHFERVLWAVVADPLVGVCGVSLLSAGERDEVLGFGGGPEIDFRRDPMHVVVGEVAGRWPDSVAAVCGDVSLSYRDLWRRSGLLAGYLRSLGVGGEDVVAVALERGVDVVVTLLGVLRAGAAFVVLDMSHPVRRLEFIISDTRAKVVVTSSAVVDGLPKPSGWAAVCVDTQWEVIADAGSGVAGGGAWQERASADSLAYVLYTSGSTGMPKGVLVEHRALMMYAASFSTLVETGPGARLLQYPSLVFDLSMGEIFSALTSGGTLVLVPPDVLLSPKDLMALMRSERVTYAGAPPAMMALLDPDPYPDLACVLVGGEAFSGELVNQWNVPGRRFINSYGPTETVVTCTAYECEHITWRSSPPIGSPLPYRKLYVVDRQGNLAPVGVPGELLIGGDEGLARGYLNQPELTAQRFIPDPWNPGGRVYRSGDLVRWRPDGQLEFIRRMDTQIKLRGLRIELEEIEAVLVTHPNVTHAAVTLADHPHTDKHLAAYIAHTNNTPPAPAQLRTHLAQHLPAYMIPTTWTILKTLPITPSGKVDRNALPPPTPIDPQPTTTHTPPQTPTEEHIAGIFADILHRTHINTHDNFFELGGNSLQAIRAITRLEQTFNITINIRHFYNTHTTVSSVAAMIDAERRQAPGDLPATPERSGHQTPLVTIASSPVGIPLFCVHPVSGSAYSYAGLSRVLGTSRPIYAFEAPGLEDDQRPIDRVEDLASAYVTALVERQPEGPYLLLGWSMGGMVAYEMARRLTDNGSAVALLSVIDGLPPDPVAGDDAETDDAETDAESPDAETIIRLFVDDLTGAAGRANQPNQPNQMPQIGQLGRLDRIPSDVAADSDLPGPAAGEDVARRLLATLQEAGLMPPGLAPEVLRRRIAVFDANLRAMRRYRPRTRYSGRLTLVRAAGSPDTRAGWRRLAEHIDDHVLPGNHYSIWDPDHLPGLAETIGRSIERALVDGFSADRPDRPGGPNGSPGPTGSIGST